MDKDAILKDPTALGAEHKSEVDINTTSSVQITTSDNTKDIEKEVNSSKDVEEIGEVVREGEGVDPIFSDPTALGADRD